MGTEISRGFCPHCGATNPPDFNYCGQCHELLPSLSSRPIGAADEVVAQPAPILSMRRAGSTTFVSLGRQAPGLLFLYFGISLIIAGIGAFFAAYLEAQSVASFNSACSRNPICTPAPDYSGAIAGLGVVLLIIGLILTYIGWSQYSGGSAEGLD